MVATLVPDKSGQRRRKMAGFYRDLPLQWPPRKVYRRYRRRGLGLNVAIAYYGLSGPKPPLAIRLFGSFCWASL